METLNETVALGCAWRRGLIRDALTLEKELKVVACEDAIVVAVNRKDAVDLGSFEKKFL
jgi:hypothetical protein